MRASLTPLACRAWQLPLARRRRRRRLRRVAGAPLRAGRLARHARRARGPGTRPLGLGRRVAPDPLLSRRRRLAHRVGPARLGAVARDRSGARRRRRRRLVRAPRRRLGGGQRGDAARRRHPLRARRRRRAVPELRVAAARCASRCWSPRRGSCARATRSRRWSRRPGPPARGWRSARRIRTARPSSWMTAGAWRPTASSGRAARGCPLFPGVLEAAHHPPGRLLLRGDADWRTPGVPGWVDYDGAAYGLGDLDGGGVKVAPDREGPVRPRDARTPRRPRARAPRAHVRRPSLPGARRRAARRPPRLPVRADRRHAVRHRPAPRARQARVVDGRRLRPRLQARPRARRADRGVADRRPGAGARASPSGRAVDERAAHRRRPTICSADAPALRERLKVAGRAADKAQVPPHGMSGSSRRARSSLRRPMRLIVARCEVRYSGRLSALLPEALRLIMVKSDGSVMVHADSRRCSSSSPTG